MPTPGFRIEVVDYAQAQDELRAVREPVFVQEQQVPLEEEWDALDPLCRHVIARDESGQPIGTGRLTPERKIGRMAVLRDWRGKGVGDALLSALMAQAWEMGWPAISLNAQVSAEPFYARHGFVPYGPGFEEAGIQHQAMRRNLKGPTPIEHAAAAIAISTALVLQARRLLRFSGVPTILEDIGLPAGPFKGLTAERLADHHGPMYALFEAEFGVRMVRADEKLRAVLPDTAQATLLGVDTTTPLLSVERIAYTYNDIPMELRRGLYRTDTHHYYNRLS